MLGLQLDNIFCSYIITIRIQIGSKVSSNYYLYQHAVYLSRYNLLQKLANKQLKF